MTHGRGIDDVEREYIAHEEGFEVPGPEIPERYSQVMASGKRGIEEPQSRD